MNEQTIESVMMNEANQLQEQNKRERTERAARKLTSTTLQRVTEAVGLLTSAKRVLAAVNDPDYNTIVARISLNKEAYETVYQFPYLAIEEIASLLEKAIKPEVKDGR